MLRMPIPRVWALLSAIGPEVSLFSASSFKVGFQNARMVAAGVWAQLSPICPKKIRCFLLVVFWRLRKIYE